MITLTSEGDIIIGEQPVAITAISELLRLRIEATAETSVRIKADQDVAVGILVRVVDEVKRSGCSGFSLVTARKGRRLTSYGRCTRSRRETAGLHKKT